MREIGIEEYKAVIFDVLCKVDGICRDNGLKYCLGDGTLLGAIRHKGFIPWDDDIDIFMPVEDYNKLADIINAEDYNLSFIRIEENKTTCFPFGKVCAKNTLINESNLRNIDGYGAFIDVFPFARIPDEDYWNNEKKWQTIKRIAAYSKLIRFSKSKSFKTNIGRALEFALSRCVNTEKLVRRIVNDTNKVNTYVKNNNLNYKYGILWAKKYRFPEDVFENQEEVEFEGHMFYGTSDPDLILRMTYGDYMKLPPKEQQIAHHYLQCWIDE